MSRVKRGVTQRNHHKAYLKLTKGFQLGRKSNFRLAKTAAFRAGQNSYRDRRRKKREFRQLWILRINAACRSEWISYSRFINGLTRSDVLVNRKMMAEIAVANPAAFKALVVIAQKALA